ncbi:SlyX protein [Marinobacterium aestuarii]|uniref:Protein SlyX homolog n=1 Tax=Marinobacterium aestuarii TaxID=1821621 RepID=A0A1A9EWV7_9GAMM|nr:SlyX family protein [Marinobacterium aestuarii]ANG62013.1 SlyX protein [Marinobacterium aestuarii]
MSDTPRLDDLESRIAFQEDTLDTLNAIVARQDIEIQRLTSMVKALSGQVKQLAPAPASADDMADEPPPPHY